LEIGVVKTEHPVVTTLFLATGNAHKVAEIRGILGAGFTLWSQPDVGARLQPEEAGATFAENARLKAVAWAVWFGSGPPGKIPEWVLADDSGLEVDALGGEPGVHSARFAARDDGRPGNSPDAENNAKLLRRLAAVPCLPRRARFRCVLALTPVLAGGSAPELVARTQCFDGVCEGRISDSAAGTHGFGYDPLFIPDGHELSLAELGDSVKNQLSHRARALAKLKTALAAAKILAASGPGAPHHP
jgi:XTP/dITP diphosphohydrolase